MLDNKHVDKDGLNYYDSKIKEYIRDLSEEFVKMGGSVHFKDLPDPSWQNLNFIYKIVDSFTSNNRFEYPGYVYPPNTWVQCVNHKQDEQWLYIVFNEPYVGDSESDFYNYYTKEEVDERIKEAVANVDIPDNIVTSEELIRELDDYVLLDSIPDPQNISSKEYVDNSIAAIKIPDVPENISDLNNDLNYLTSHQASATYAKKSALNNLVTKEYLEAELDNIDISEVDLSEYVTFDMLKSLLADYAKSSEIPDVSKFITEEDVNKKEYCTQADLLKTLNKIKFIDGSTSTSIMN